MNKMANIISIHSFRRATGKSTIAANISSLLALAGRRVGLVDADLQSPGLATLFGLDPAALSRSFNDFLWGKCDIEQTAHDVTASLHVVTDGRIFLVPASDDPNAIARMLRKGYDLKLLNDCFQTLVEQLELDTLIVDVHAGLHEESLTLMAISDMLAIVLRHDIQDYQGTAVTMGVARNL
jgi:MinD-like ATPase involved in chromosome partitioning or flagellar assembly